MSNGEGENKKKVESIEGRVSGGEGESKEIIGNIHERQGRQS
jgi:hypothetical protein